MILKRLLVSLGALFAFFGSAALAVFLLSLDSKARHDGAMWTGLLLGPAVGFLFLLLVFMIAPLFGSGLVAWWRWLHGRKDERWYP